MTFTRSRRTGFSGAWWRWCSAAALATTLAACGGGGGSAASGTLRVALTDAPSCGYDHVYVTVEKVRVHQSSGAGDADAGWSEITLSPPRRIDLLSLTNGALEELGSTPLPAGSYQQIRLVLAENLPSAAPAANALVLSTDPTNEIEIPLKTPSGQQSGLKLQAHFDVVANEMADLVLDFDACKSIVKSGNSGNYNLKPVVSVFKRLTTAIEGYVAPAMVSTGVVVSAQQGDRVVRSTVPATDGKFLISWLPVDSTSGLGTYTVVVAGNGYATAVVTSVPVATATGTTLLNTSTAAITPAASTMGSVTGTVTLSPSSTPLTSATVAATQALTGGPTIMLANVPVNAVDATYALSLPKAGPVKAAFGPMLNFGTADTAVAGKYSLTATDPVQGSKTSPVVDLSTGDKAVLFTFP